MSIVSEIVLTYLKDFSATVIRNMNEKDRNASRRFVNSIKQRVEEQGDTINGQVTALEYFKWMDQGRGPGKFPPRQTIEDWIRVKNIKPFTDKKGRPIPIKSQAFLISRKMANEGTTIFRRKQNDMVIASALQSKPIRSLAQELIKAQVQDFKQMVKESK